MWVCLNNAFLSIVSSKENNALLLVRARRAGDIESVFPGAVVETIPGRDYMFRARIAREEVGAALAAKAVSIDYGNFKDSVANDALHSAYAGVWHIMERLQPFRAYTQFNIKRSSERSYFNGDTNE